MVVAEKTVVEIITFAARFHTSFQNSFTEIYSSQILQNITHLKFVWFQCVLFLPRLNASFGDKSTLLQKVIIKILIEVPISFSIHGSESHIAEEAFQLYSEFFAQI